MLSWACRFLRQKAGIPPEQRTDDQLLEDFGLTANPTASTVTVFGPFRYQWETQPMEWISQLWKLGQSAMLS